MLTFPPTYIASIYGALVRKIWLSHGFSEPMPKETRGLRTYSSILLWIRSVPILAFNALVNKVGLPQ